MPSTQRIVTIVLFLALFCSFSTEAYSATAAKPQKSTSKLSAVGVNQLPGDWCKFGIGYTLGDPSAEHINLTVLSAEYQAVRVAMDDWYDYPVAGEKLLVVHYSLQNSSKAQMSVSGIEWVAVDDQGVDHRWSYQWLEQAGKLSRQATPLRAKISLAVDTTYSRPLEPGQKLYAYAIIHIPAKCSIPKMIASFSSSPTVARYDLHGLIKPLAKPYLDPTDTTGAVAIDAVPGEVGGTYSSGNIDVAIDKVEFYSKPLFDEELPADSEYVIITEKCTSFEQDPQSIDSACNLELKDQDGTVCSQSYKSLALTGNREVSITLKQKETGCVRSVFCVHKGVGLKTLKFWGNNATPVVIDLSTYKAP